MAAILRKQTVSETEKLTPAFAQNVADYWIEQAGFSSQVYSDMARLYRAIDGALNVGDYNYVLNPYNSDDDRLTAFPARLRNINILKPVRDLFLGEQSKKPMNMEVVITNEDAENVMKEALQMKASRILAQDAVNHLNAAGVQTGVESKPVPDMAQIAKEHVENWNDERAMIGQEALNYIMSFADFDEKTQMLLNDWLITGRCFTDKDAQYGDVVYDYVSPLDFWCLKSPDSQFVEDGVAAVRRFYMLINDVVDKMRDWIDPADIEKLETEANQSITPSDPSGFTYIRSDANMDGIASPYGRLGGGRLECFHYTFKSMRKVGLLTYQNELGQVTETAVEEGYVLDTTKGDIKLEWEWQSQTREGYKFGQSIYTKCVPCKVQRDELSNTSKCKLRYNGRIESTLNGEVSSVIKDGLVYQVLYNIYHYRRENTINKNKDKILMFPLGAVPARFGVGGKDPLDVFMHYMDANSIGFFDETKPNAVAALQALKAMDMGLYQYLQGMTDVLTSLRNEWWDAVGVNRQRYGDTQASDGKGVNEQAIFRSAIISAERNRKFNKLLEKDCNGLLDVSKLAFSEGKKATYVTSDRRRVFFSLNPIKHNEADYAVFCVNQDQEHEELQALKTAAVNFSQRADVAPSTVAHIIKSKNYSKVQSIMEKEEKLWKAYEKAKQDSVNDTNKYVADKTMEAAKLKSDDVRYVADRRYEQGVEVATINQEGRETGLGDGNYDDDNDSDYERIALDREKMYLEHATGNRKLAIDADKNRITEKANDEANEVAHEKVKVDRIKARKPSSK